jgi:hypothetical protein
VLGPYSPPILPVVDSNGDVVACSQRSAQALLFSGPLLLKLVRVLPLSGFEGKFLFADVIEAERGLRVTLTTVQNTLVTAPNSREHDLVC